MKADILKNIKERITALLVVAEAVALVWKSYPSTSVNVLLQNAQFSGLGCYGYDHDKAVDELFTIQKAIAAIDEYMEHDHFLSFIRREVDMIIESGEMNELYEEYVEAEKVLSKESY